MCEDQAYQHLPWVFPASSSPSGPLGLCPPPRTPNNHMSRASGSKDRVLKPARSAPDLKNQNPGLVLGVCVLSSSPTAMPVQLETSH